MRSLNRIKVGLKWTAGLGLAQKFVQLAALAVLARVLTPEDYGFYIALLVLVGFAQALLAGVVGSFLLYAKNLRAEDVGSGWVLLALVLCVYILGLWIFGDVINDLLGVNFDGLVLVVLSLAISVLGLNTFFIYYGYRRRFFAWVGFSDLASYLFGFFAVSFLLAIGGYGGWALLWGFLAQQFVMSVVLLVKVRVFCVKCPRLKGLVTYFRFGFWSASSKLAQMIAVQADKIVASAVLGVGALGLYSRAYQLATLPGDFYGRFGEKTVLAVFSRAVRGGGSSFRVQMVGVAVALAFGVAFAIPLHLSAAGVVKIVFGDGWLGLVECLGILAWFVPFGIGYRYYDSLLRSQGLVKVSAAISLFNAVVVPVLSLLGVREGLNGLSWAIVASSLLVFVVSMVSFHRRAGVSFSISWVVVGFPLGLGGGVAYGLDWMVESAFGAHLWNEYFLLFVGLLVSFVYFLVVIFFMKLVVLRSSRNF